MKALCVALSFCLLFGVPVPASAAIEEQLKLTAGQSTVLSYQEPFERVSVNNETVAEAIVISPQEILVHGKQSGSTTMVVWRASGNELYEVVVRAAPYRRTSFEEFLKDLMPEETELQAYESGETIVLAGKVKHPANLIKAQQVAQSSAKQVVNLTDVGDPKQVLIEVRIAEVERTLARSLGVDYVFQNSRVTQSGFTAGALDPQTPTTPQFTRIDPTDILMNQATQGLFETRQDDFDLSVAINALEEKGLLRILAEPNLLAMSGQEATFLAGGEFPIPVAQASAGGTAITIVFKEFGIRLRFKPEVMANDHIRLAVAPEVSVLDFSQAAVEISGFEIPGLIVRRASTTVEMKPGESLVIGGLLSQNNEKTDEKIPLLGDIPVLGALFSSKSFNNKETELLVLVTPRLPKAHNLPLPEAFADPQRVMEILQDKPPQPYAEPSGDRIREAITGTAASPLP